MATDISSEAEKKVRLDLAGVPETLLWPLYSRAAEARRPDALLQDPLAVRLVDGIDYPFEKNFGRADEHHVLKALRFDEQIRLYLHDRPECTVAALGDGLETEVQRVDNGRLKWLVVDLPEAIVVRDLLFETSERCRHVACSALDFRWIDEVDNSRGVFVTAKAVLMYLEPAEVRSLIAECAERFPGGRMMFDMIPRWYSQKTLTGNDLTGSYTTPRMPFGMDVNEIPNIRSFHPNISNVREIPFGKGRGFHFRYKIPVRNWLPVIRNRRSSIVLITFGS